MACNGYNHPSNCNCGWGGKNYVNNSNNSVTIINAYNQIFQPKNTNQNEYSNFKTPTYESFTIPNVQCNCCGKEIFFYQSPYKGRVFFEELGPPWKKHCCEPKCCSSTNENIYKKISSNVSIEYKQPLWEKNNWIPCLLIEEKFCDTLVKKIILKSVSTNEIHTFYIQKKYFKKKFNKGLLIYFKQINQEYFQISFYNDNLLEESKFIVSIYPSNYELEVFIFIRKSLDLIKSKNIEDIELVKIFFKILTISDNYKNEKKQLNNFIINHESSKKSGMSDIYDYINRFGLQKFEENFLNSFKYYDKEIIEIFSSIKNISALSNIHKIILRKQENYINVNNHKNTKKINSTSQKNTKQNFAEKVEMISKNKKNNMISKPKRTRWKGITTYKPKKLVFIKKENDL